MSIELLNELADPVEDVTEEIRAEAEEHQVFVYGSSVIGPGSNGDGLLTHEYADIESDYVPNDVGEDLPLGLVNTIITGTPGDGQLDVMLRHLPALNDTPQKEPGLAEEFARDEPIAGLVDVDVSFEVTVE